MFMALGAGPSYQDDGDRLDVIVSVRLKSPSFSSPRLRKSEIQQSSIARP